MAYYNVYIEHSPEKKSYIIALNQEQIEKLIRAYLHGEKTVLLKGVERNINRPDKLIIYSINQSLGLAGPQIAVEENLRKYARIEGAKISQRFFTKYGSNVTDSLTGGEGWGSKSYSNTKHRQTGNNSFYISISRIDELKKLKQTNYDLTRLVRLCEEINICFNNQCYFATGALARSIIDHVPPIFQKKNFDDVASSYSANGRSRSFKESMEQLNKSMRKISDRIVHTQITNSETLLNEMQVDCRRDLDVLLEEIVRVLK